MTSTISLIANSGIKGATDGIQAVSTRFATGKRLTKPSEDLFASIQISSGEEKLQYYDSALASLQRLRSILSTRDGSLQTMKKGVQQLSQLALGASSAISDSERNSAQASFQQVMSRVADIATTSEYSGIKLLDGSFGGSVGFKPAAEVYNPVATWANPAAMVGGLVNTAAQPTQSTDITFAGVAAGETISIDGVDFTFSTNPASPNDILIGATNEETALNALAALNNLNVAGDSLRKYAYSVAGDVLTVTTLNSTNTPLDATNVTSSNNVHLAVAHAAAAANAPIMNFSGYVAAKDVIGQLGNISLVTRLAAASDANGAIANSVPVATMNAVLDHYGPTVAAARVIGAPAGANGGAFLLESTFSIGNVQYKGVMVHTTAAGAPRTMYCKRADVDIARDDQVFTINFNADQNLGAGGALGAMASAIGVSTAWNSSAPSITVKQTEIMNIDTDKGDFFLEGKRIGSVRGMAVQLNSATIDNNVVKSLTIAGDVFTIIINDGTKDKTFKSVTAAATSIAGGTKIDCTDAISGDVLSITIGDTTLDLSSETKQKSAAANIFAAISSNTATFIVGTDVSQTLDMRLANTTWDVLTGKALLTLDSQENARNATTLLQNVIEQLGAEIAINAAYDLAVSSLHDQTIVSQQNLSAAVEAISAVDIPEEKTKLDDFMTQIRASASTMIAQQAMRRTIESVLQN